MRVSAAAVVVGVVMAAVAVGGLASCGDGDDETAPPTTRPEATTTTDAVPDDTTSSSEGPTGDRCEAAPVSSPGDPLAGLALDDLGGEGGLGDTAHTYLGDDGWHLRVELDFQRGSADELLTTVPSDTASVATARDLDLDGDQELFVIVGNGASAQIYGIYGLDGCDLEAVQFADGRPAELPVGGSVVELHGLRCEVDGGVSVLTSTSEDGVDYTAETRTYELDGGVLTEVATNAASTSTSDPQFPELSRFGC